MTTMGEADEAEGIVAEAADQEVDVGEDEDEAHTREVKALMNAPVKAVASPRRRATFVRILGIWNETARSKCGTKRSI